MEELLLTTEDSNNMSLVKGYYMWVSVRQDKEPFKSDQMQCASTIFTQILRVHILSKIKETAFLNAANQIKETFQMKSNKH
jgi:hypothetical protein